MFFETLLQDLRIGVRVLFKEKSFCVLAVAVLAIGICAVTTQYAVVNGVLLRGFSFPNPERLVSVQLVDPSNFTPANYNSRQTTADFVDLREQAKSFDAMVGYLGNTTVNLTYRDQPRRLQGGYVPYDFFRTLGVAPVIGRDFLPEDDRPGVNEAVLLSDALWRSDFGGDPDVLGRAVRVNGRAGTIIGVMPPKFSFPTYEQVWIPFNAEYPVRPRNDRNANFISIVGRLKAGVSLEAAEAEVTSLALQFAKTYPDTNQAYSRGYVHPLIEIFTGSSLRGLLLLMLGFCGGVLLIACVNVMNMQFARATLRAKELAIRSALGASRGRLIRQMLTESFLLATLGAVIGIALAYYATSYLNAAKQNLTNPLPGWMVFSIDGRVLGFVVGMTMLAALVAGFVPAWLASRADTGLVLKESGRGNTGRAVGVITRGLVVFQILVTSVLLIWALLQLQSIQRQQNVNFGYDTGAVLGARLGLMQGDYPTPTQRQVFYEKVLRELRATPAFEAAALTSRNRLVLSSSGLVEIEGRAYTADRDRSTAIYEAVSAGYFDVLGVKLRDGREFTDQDTDQRQPVAVVNAAFVKSHFGRDSAVGRRFRTVQTNGVNPSPWRTIVGVVGEVRMQDPYDQGNGAGFYLPFFATAFGATPAQPVPPAFSTIAILPSGGQRPETLSTALQGVVNKVDANLPLYYFMTPRTALAGFLAQNNFVAVMFGLFGLVAVVLVAVGLYGIMSFSVNQRRQEFGIRMALGADAGSILGMVFRQGGVQLVIGLGLGLGAALVVALLDLGAIRGMLFGISARDPLTFAAVAGLLTLVAFLAMLVPALRATRVDPMVALRAE